MQASACSPHRLLDATLQVTRIYDDPEGTGNARNSTSRKNCAYSDSWTQEDATKKDKIQSAVNAEYSISVLKDNAGEMKVLLDQCLACRRRFFTLAEHDK